MALVDTLAYLFPAAIAGKDFVLQNDGAGDYIAKWSLAAKQPSASAISSASAAASLAQAQAAQIAIMSAAYQSAIAQPVSYTSKGGITKTYQADPGSVANLQATLLGMQAAAATPSGFYWVSADNTQVPFAYADLQGLAAAMLAQGWGAFQKLQMLKGQINGATTVSAVQAVTW